MDLVERLLPLLAGIDQTETDSPDGWWETSEGARFGSNVKRQIMLEAKVADDEIERLREELDNSLNEFEKLITHVLDMLQYHRRRAEMLGLPDDPRDSIRAIESSINEVRTAKIKLAAALYAARGDLPDYGVALRDEAE